MTSQAPNFKRGSKSIVVAIALRADPITRKVHIIMCTGTAEVTVRETFTQYHAFLAKPVEPTDLMRSLDLAFATQ